MQTYLIGKYLTRLGWQVHFIAETDKPDLVKSVTHDDILVHRVKRRLLFAQRRRDIGMLLDAIQPDIIYQRGRSHLTSGKSVMKYAAENKIPRMYQIAEDSDLEPMLPIRVWLSSASSWFKKVVLLPDAIMSMYYFRKSLSCADVIVAQTRTQAQSVERKTGKRAILIRSGHDPIVGEPVKSEPPIVLWIAHAGRRKQPELFIKLAQSLQDTNAQFVLAGTVPDSNYRAKIVAEVDRTPNLKYVGAVGWQEAESWFLKASVFVNTTEENREGFPNTYIQSWLTQTPVVTLHCDPDDIISSHELGFHSKTFENLVLDVKRLIESAEMRTRMGENAKRYAEKHHMASENTRRIHVVAKAALLPEVGEPV